MARLCLRLTEIQSFLVMCERLHFGDLVNESLVAEFVRTAICHTYMSYGGSSQTHVDCILTIYKARRAQVKDCINVPKLWYDGYIHHWRSTTHMMAEVDNNSTCTFPLPYANGAMLLNSQSMPGTDECDRDVSPPDSDGVTVAPTHESGN